MAATPATPHSRPPPSLAAGCAPQFCSHWHLHFFSLILLFFFICSQADVNELSCIKKYNKKYRKIFMFYFFSTCPIPSAPPLLPAPALELISLPTVEWFMQFRFTFLALHLLPDWNGVELRLLRLLRPLGAQPEVSWTILALISTAQ